MKPNDRRKKRFKGGTEAEVALGAQKKLGKEK